MAESHVGTSFMVCAPAIEALKEPPRKMDEFILGKQQADGSWEHPGSTLGAPWELPGSTLGAHRERSMSQRCILATAQVN